MGEQQLPAFAQTLHCGERGADATAQDVRAEVIHRDLVTLLLFLWYLAYHAVGARYWL